MHPATSSVEIARLTAVFGGGLIAGAASLRGGEVQNVASISGSACSPPRSTFVPRVRSSTTVTAPARSFVVSKKKRRRRGGSDAGDSGGDDDGPGDGGSWGSGGWGDDGGEGDNNNPWQLQNLWAWQIICICSLLQAAHYLLIQRSKGSHSECEPRSVEFAAVTTAQ